MALGAIQLKNLNTEDQLQQEAKDAFQKDNNTVQLSVSKNSA